jgi:L-ascorbate metabolism protein UlaG (beta-lactamase superfamily)
MEKFERARAPETQRIDKQAFAPCDCTTIRWLGGAGFMINSRGTIIMVDPVISTQPGDTQTCETGHKKLIDYPIAAADVPQIHAVLYSHSDGDHLGAKTAQTLSKRDLIMIGPPPVFEKLARLGVAPEKIESCRTGDQLRVQDITIEVTPADHPWQLKYPGQRGKPFRAGDCCGYVVYTPDGKLYFPGDTRLMEEHLSIKEVDVLAVDVSYDIYHLGVAGATALANSLSTALLIPYHYGTYDEPHNSAYCGVPAKVFDNVSASEKRARILGPGQPLSIRAGHEC